MCVCACVCTADVVSLVTNLRTGGAHFHEGTDESDWLSKNSREGRSGGLTEEADEGQGGGVMVEKTDEEGDEECILVQRTLRGGGLAEEADGGGGGCVEEEADEGGDGVGVAANEATADGDEEGVLMQRTLSAGSTCGAIEGGGGGDGEEEEVVVVEEEVLAIERQGRVSESVPSLDGHGENGADEVVQLPVEGRAKTEDETADLCVEEVDEGHLVSWRAGDRDGEVGSGPI